MTEALAILRFSIFSPFFFSSLTLCSEDNFQKNFLLKSISPLRLVLLRVGGAAFTTSLLCESSAPDAGRRPHIISALKLPCPPPCFLSPAFPVLAALRVWDQITLEGDTLERPIVFCCCPWAFPLPWSPLRAQNALARSQTLSGLGAPSHLPQ